MTIISSPYLGAGFAPAGFSPGGYGTPATQSEPTRQDFIIDEGPYAGLVGDVRLLDPITQDYRMNDNGYFVGGIGIQQMVYLALLTVKGSSLDSSLGQSYSNVKVIGTNFQQSITNEVNNALSNLVNSKKITINTVNVVKQNNMLRIDVRWTDLTRGITLTSSIV